MSKNTAKAERAAQTLVDAASEFAKATFFETADDEKVREVREAVDRGATFVLQIESSENVETLIALSLKFSEDGQTMVWPLATASTRSALH